MAPCNGSKPVRFFPCLVLTGGLLSAFPAAAGTPLPPSPAEISAARDFILAPTPAMTGDPLDMKIAAARKILREAPAGSPRLEELGWLFVAKARASDESWYRRAEACATLIDAAAPGSAAGLLLKGHVLQSTHRFAEAESAARTLVATRGLAHDFGLLGDALMEQGRLKTALEAYQAMMDRKPGYQAYARAAHMRWLHGDAEGAAEMMAMAVSACSPRDAEAMAWARVKLAGYRFQLAKRTEAKALCDEALGYFPGYPPALLLRGRILASRGRTSAALPDLAASARSRSLPEALWAYSDALRQSGRAAAADSLDNIMAANGARLDPRTFSLWLATRAVDGRNQAARPGRASRPDPEAGRGDASLAVSLVARELRVRGDVFTHDAAAWAAYASGDAAAASAHADSALAAGTKDARLFLHAGVIARAAGREAHARACLASARALAPMLLPSERRLLDNALARTAPGLRPSAAVPM